MKKSTNTFYLGELFCGPGGLAWGATNAKIDNSEFRIIHKWANDYDQSTCKTYTRNICPNNPESVYCEDVHTLDISRLGSIDALAFGFPCNDFSVVGEQLGFKGKFGPLYTYSQNFLLRKWKEYICRFEKWGMLAVVSRILSVVDLMHDSIF